jgi:hypothetical protein
MADILQTTKLGIRFYIWVIIGPRYLKMKRSISRIVIAVRGWTGQAKLMKFPYNHKW